MCSSDLAIKKVGHFSLYFVLATALAFGFDRSLRGSSLATWGLRFALTVAIAYAATDELHQAFTPTRDASISDVMIDSAGAIAGVLVWRQVTRWLAGPRRPDPH